MLKKYKKSYLIINTVLAILIIFLNINFFILKNTSYLFLLVSILIPTVLLIAVYGYEKKKRRFTYELIFYIFTYCITFLILSYLAGTIVGFTRNIYKLNIDNIITNIIPYALLIIISEVLRFQIIRKGEGSDLSYLLVTISLILVDLTLFLNNYNLDVNDEKIKFICLILLPSLFKNIILTYFTKNGGMAPSILYRIILDLKIVILPIFPNFGTYFQAIIDTIVPILIGFIIYISLLKFKNKEMNNDNKINNFYKYIILALLLVLALTVNFLTSGTFRYGMMSIGSGSMHPKINKGDSVIYEKISDNNLPKVGDVIAFKKEKKVIIHRIIEITEVNEQERIYYTKGDANPKPDGYPILEEDILGKVVFRIKYIGIPSVILGEMLQ